MYIKARPNIFQYLFIIIYFRGKGKVTKKKSMYKNVGRTLARAERCERKKEKGLCMAITRMFCIIHRRQLDNIKLDNPRLPSSLEFPSVSPSSFLEISNPLLGGGGNPNRYVSIGTNAPQMARKPDNWIVYGFANAICARAPANISCNLRDAHTTLVQT